MLPFTDTTFARRAEDEADPRDVAAMHAEHALGDSVGTLLGLGMSKTEILAFVDEAIARAVAKFTAPRLALPKPTF